MYMGIVYTKGQNKILAVEWYQRIFRDIQGNIIKIQKLLSNQKRVGPSTLIYSLFKLHGHLDVWLWFPQRNCPLLWAGRLCSWASTPQDSFFFPSQNHIPVSEEYYRITVEFLTGLSWYLHWHSSQRFLGLGSAEESLYILCSFGAAKMNNKGWRGYTIIPENFFTLKRPFFNTLVIECMCLWDWLLQCFHFQPQPTCKKKKKRQGHI